LTRRDTLEDFATKRSKIEELLGTYVEAKEAGSYASHGPAGDGGGVPMMALAWHQGSYKPLEDLMKNRMQDERPKQYNHVSARYFQAVRRIAKVRRRGAVVLNLAPNEAVVGMQLGTKEKGKSTLTEDEMVVECWPGWVRRHVVHAGVSWIVREFPCEPQLPVEWIQAA
jgi:hypothetical protein